MRLDSATTDEVHRLWKENDRERYSEEAFEAARVILTERGMDVPAQQPWSGRVPVARKARSLDPASDAFWMAWLRPVLWVGIVIGGMRTLYLAILATQSVRAETPLSWPIVDSFSGLVVAIQSVLNLVLPVVLLSGAALS